MGRNGSTANRLELHLVAEVRLALERIDDLCRELMIHKLNEIAKFNQRLRDVSPTTGGVAGPVESGEKGESPINPRATW